jgi:hypothetical protein
MTGIVPTLDQYDDYYSCKPLTHYWLNHVQSEIQKLSDLLASGNGTELQIDTAINSFQWLHSKWKSMEEDLYQANKHLTWYTRRVCIIR